MVNIKITRQKRTDLADMFGSLGFKRGAEIGVRTGLFSETLCTHIKSLEKLYSIDPWDLVFEDPISRGFQRKYGDIEPDKDDELPVPNWWFVKQ